MSNPILFQSAGKGKPAVLVSFRDVTERKMIEHERALCAWEQEKLSEIDKQLIGIANLGKIFDAIVHQTIKLTGSGFAGIIVYDIGIGRLLLESIKHRNMHEDSRRLEKSRSDVQNP